MTIRNTILNAIAALLLVASLVGCSSSSKGGAGASAEPQSIDTALFIGAPISTDGQSFPVNHRVVIGHSVSPNISSIDVAWSVSGGSLSGIPVADSESFYFTPSSTGIRTITARSRRDGETIASASITVTILSEDDFQDVAITPNIRQLSLDSNVSSVVLNWTNPLDPNFRSVIIERDTASDMKNPVEVFRGFAATFTDKQLNPNQRYYYRIRSIYSNSESAPIVRSVTTEEAIAPSNLEANRHGSNVQLLWDNPDVDNIQAIIILRSLSHQNIDDAIKIGAGFIDTFIDNTAENFTSYRYYVITEFTDLSKSIPVSIDYVHAHVQSTLNIANVLATPATVQVVGTETVVNYTLSPSNPNLSVDWEVTGAYSGSTPIESKNELRFTATSPGAITIIARTMLRGTEIERSTLNITIATLDDFNQVANTPNVTAFTTEARYESIQLRWQNPTHPDFQSIELERATQSNFNDATQIATGKITAFTDTGLDQNRQYYYRIKARYSNSTSFSQQLSAITLHASSPSNFETEFGNRNVTLRWTNPNGADFDQIIIRRGTSQQTFGEAEVIASVNANQYIDTTVENFTEYRYWISARYLDGAESSSVSLTSRPSTAKVFIGDLRTSTSDIHAFRINQTLYIAKRNTSNIEVYQRDGNQWTKVHTIKTFLSQRILSMKVNSGANSAQIVYSEATFLDTNQIKVVDFDGATATTVGQFILYGSFSASREEDNLVMAYQDSPTSIKVVEYDGQSFEQLGNRISVSKKFSIEAVAKASSSYFLSLDNDYQFKLDTKNSAEWNPILSLESFVSGDSYNVQYVDNDSDIWLFFSSNSDLSTLFIFRLSDSSTNFVTAFSSSSGSTNWIGAPSSADRFSILFNDTDGSSTFMDYSFQNQSLENHTRFSGLTMTSGIEVNNIDYVVGFDDNSRVILMEKLY